MNEFQAGIIRYYSSNTNRLKTFKKAKKHLESLFDISLSLSDKMQLRHETDLMIDEAVKSNSDIENYQEPAKMAQVRFLVINYPSLDRQLIARTIINCYPSPTLNKEIRLLREIN